MEQVRIQGREIDETTALGGYLENLHALFSPGSLKDLQRLLQVFEGRLEVDPDVKVIGGPWTFRNVVLQGEMQPSEWPKYRYLFLELWAPADEALSAALVADRDNCRKTLAKALAARRVRAYCDDNAVPLEQLSKAKLDEITAKAKGDFETFLANVRGKATSLPLELFENVVAAAPSAPENA